jgi:hypothetical protein
MATHENRVQGAVRRVEREFRKLQRSVESRRKRLEKELTSRRKAFERRAQKELTRFQKELSRQPLMKRANTLRSEAQNRFDEGVATVLDALPIATKREVERIERKLRSIDRKLRELEKGQEASEAA